MAMNPSRSSPQNVPRLTSPSFRAPGPGKQGHLSGSHLSVFMAGGSEKWQNNVIRGRVHSCDRRQGDPNWFYIYLSELPIRFVPTQTNTSLHHICVTILVELKRKIGTFLNWIFQPPFMLKANYFFVDSLGSSPAGLFFTLGRCQAHSCLYIPVSPFPSPNFLRPVPFTHSYFPSRCLSYSPHFYLHYSIILIWLGIINIFFYFFICVLPTLSLEYKFHEIRGLI